MRQNYLDFLRYSLDAGQSLPDSVDGIDWMDLMSWSERQGVVGVVYVGIQRCGRDLGIPFDALMEWVGYASQIEAQNRLLNNRCAGLRADLCKAGFESCILKGQGNALMYPVPLLRTPGDIDVWCVSRRRVGNAGLCTVRSVRSVIAYARRQNPGAKACYHHVDYGDYKGAEVELHYRPSFMHNPFANRRLQKWFDAHIQEQFHNIKALPDGEGEISVPTWEFNVVYQLSHIYVHVLKEGIGLRHLTDYYILLRHALGRQGSYNDRLGLTLRRLGLSGIAGAVMWVLHESLGLDERYLISPVDERRGRLLLSEMMRGGNFGRYDSRSPRHGGPLRSNLKRLSRDARLIRYFPSECLWEPVFRVWHFFWRLAH